MDYPNSKKKRTSVRKILLTSACGMANLKFDCIYIYIYFACDVAKLKFDFKRSKIYIYIKDILHE